MNVKDAIYRAVHDYPGGAEALAPRIGLSPHSLRHMADPNKQTHGWSLRRFDMLLAHAGIGPLSAMCEEHHGIFVPLGEFADAPHAQVLKQLHQLAKEFGDVPRVIEQALKVDGKISDNELKRIERELAELVGAGASVLAVVRQIHDGRKSVEEAQRP
jgi:hypothetical protein